MGPGHAAATAVAEHRGARSGRRVLGITASGPLRAPVRRGHLAEDAADVGRTHVVVARARTRQRRSRCCLVGTRRLSRRSSCVARTPPSTTSRRVRRDGVARSSAGSAHLVPPRSTRAPRAWTSSVAGRIVPSINGRGSPASAGCPVGSPSGASPPRTRTPRLREADAFPQLFVRGTDDAAYQLYWDGAQWVVVYLGGVCTSGPSATYCGPTRLDVFCRGTDMAIWHLYWLRQSGWSGWERIDSVVISDPEATSPGPGGLPQVFARGLTAGCSSTGGTARHGRPRAGASSDRSRSQYLTPRRRFPRRPCPLGR